MTHKDYVDMAYARYEHIVALYRQFQDEKPVMLYEIADGKIYAYSYVDFKADLTERSQALLTKEYRKACSKKKMVIFVRDRANKKFVSFSIPIHEEAAAGYPVRQILDAVPQRRLP